MAEAGEDGPPPAPKKALPRGVSYDRGQGRTRFIGDAGVSFWRSGLEIDTPFDANGIVQDYDTFEELSRHALQVLSADPAENPLLLTEPSTNPKAVRAKMAEVAFEGNKNDHEHHDRGEKSQDLAD